MRRNLLMCFLIGAPWVVSAQVKEESNEVTALRAEVRRLASELLQHRAEFTRWRIHCMSAELQQVQAERQRLSAERQLIEREIGELNQASANGPGADDEDRKEELRTIHLPALLDSERAANMREVTLSTALNGESARMTEIQEQAERLAARAPKSK